MPMTDIQNAMDLLIGAFHKYSGKDGDQKHISKSELKDLLKGELGIMGEAKDKQAVDKIFKELDENKDNQVDFAEYVALVGVLTMLTNEALTK